MWVLRKNILRQKVLGYSIPGVFCLGTLCHRGHLCLDMFVSWDKLFLRTYCPWDALSLWIFCPLGQFVSRTICLELFCLGDVLSVLGARSSIELQSFHLVFILVVHKWDLCVYCIHMYSLVGYALPRAGCMYVIFTGRICILLCENRYRTHEY